MADETPYKVIYSRRSLANIRTIKDYLLYKFTQREVDNLYRMLNDFENVAASFPQLYPLISNSKKIRQLSLANNYQYFIHIQKIN